MRPAWLFIGSTILSTGCATHVKPPVDVQTPATVYIADYGLHSSLLLPDATQGLVEFAFGDWEWFALNHDQWYDALRIAIFPGRGTLGTRALPAVTTGDELPQWLGPVQAHALVVEKERAGKLLQRLQAEYARGVDEAVLNSQTSLWCAPTTGKYRPLKNCNAAVAGWLEELGCRVHGPRIGSEFVIDHR